jgi:hypothetical protein
MWIYGKRECAGGIFLDVFSMLKQVTKQGNLHHPLKNIPFKGIFPLRQNSPILYLSLIFTRFLLSP